MAKGRSCFLPNPQLNSWFSRLITYPSVIFFQAKESWLIIEVFFFSSELFQVFDHCCCHHLSFKLYYISWQEERTVAFRMWLQARFTQCHGNLVWFTLCSSSSNSQQLLVGFPSHGGITPRSHFWMVMVSFDTIFMSYICLLVTLRDLGLMSCLVIFFIKWFTFFFHLHFLTASIWMR